MPVKHTDRRYYDPGLARVGAYGEAGRVAAAAARNSQRMVAPRPTLPQAPQQVKNPLSTKTYLVNFLDPFRS